MPELSTATADASLAGTEPLLTTAFETVTLQQAANFPESKGTNIASAATTDIGAATGPFVHVTGTTTITALGTIQAGTERVVVFDGILTLTHNATSLILPTGASITTAAGDAAFFRSEGSGNWRCVSYMRASGAPLAGGAGAGDVVGPVSSVDDRIATFDGTTGKLLQDGGKTINEVRTHSIIVACSDETTNLTAGTAKATFRMPYAFTLTAVRASLSTAQSAGSIFTVDINEAGTTILSTKLTIDNTEKTSTTAATPVVISDSSIADDAEITIDIDQVGTAGARGLKVTLIGYPT
jgi:hypothetical protein